MQRLPAREIPSDQTTRQPALRYEEDQPTTTSFGEDPLSSLLLETEDATQRTFLPPLREEDIFAEEEALDGPATRVLPKPLRARGEPSGPSSPARGGRGSPSLRPASPGAAASGKLPSPGAAARPARRSRNEETRLDRPTAPMLGRVSPQPARSGAPEQTSGAKHPPPRERRAAGRPTPPPSPVVPPPPPSPPVPATPYAQKATPPPAPIERAPSPPPEPAPPAPVEAATAPAPIAPIAISAPAPVFDPTPAPPPPASPGPSWESSPLDPEASLYSPSYRSAMLDQDSEAFAPTPSVVKMLKGMGSSPAAKAGGFWKNPLYLSLIGLGGLLAVVLVWGLSTTEAPRKPTPPILPPASYETPALPKRPGGSETEPVEKVALGFHINPKSADILLWVNKEKYPTPPARGSIDVPKGASVEITVAAPGYKPQQRSLVIKKTEIIDVKLVPLKRR